MDHRVEMPRAFMILICMLEIVFFGCRVFLLFPPLCASSFGLRVLLVSRSVVSFGLFVFLGLLLSQAGQVSVWDKYNPKKIWKQPDPQVLCKVYIPKGDSHAARLMDPLFGEVAP